MARNIEIKARVANLDAVRRRVAACADGPPVALDQDDTFFACAHGRLKLRVFADGRGELIAYQRADTAGPKTSDYRITSVDDPDALRETLGRALGLRGRVVKQRELWLAGQTRIHLDRVEGLGDFVELEVVLRAGQAPEAGVAIAQALLSRLEIAASQLVAGAYIDLLVKAPA